MTCKVHLYFFIELTPGSSFTSEAQISVAINPHSKEVKSLFNESSTRSGNTPVALNTKTVQ